MFYLIDIYIVGKIIIWIFYSIVIIIVFEFNVFRVYYLRNFI